MARIEAKRGRLFTVREAAQYLGMKEDRARRLVARRELAAIFHPTGRVAGVYERECDAWLERSERAAAAAPNPKSADRDAAIDALPGADMFA